MALVHEQEKELQREVAETVQERLPGVEVLAVEMTGPDRMTVYIDHSEGVDHALCERVTGVLRGYLDRFTLDVSSPGLERPLRTWAHFADAVGRRVNVRTSVDVGGRKRFRGEVVNASEREATIAVGEDEVAVPYDVIVRGNLIEEGR
jgi:ribosome maturation factor RimP